MRARLVIAAALAVLLAGCTAAVGGPVSNGTVSGGVASGVPASGPDGATAPSPSSADLVAARRAAGIADCPSSSAAKAAAGGLPDITLDCLGGDSTVRLAGLRGPLLVNLWAQWCQPCRAEAAHISAFAAMSTTVKVLGINYTDPQPDLAIEFAQLTAMKYPQLTDPSARLRAGLGVTGIPWTVLIDASGRIVARHPGPFASLEDVTGWVKKALP